jgi:hypothetical protein
MSEDTLQRISREMSKLLGSELQPQDGMLVLSDESEQNQITLEQGALDGQLYLTSPIFQMPPESLHWPQTDERKAPKPMLDYAAVSRLMLVLNGDTQTHASRTVALESGTEQLMLIERLPKDLSGQEALARINAAGEYISRLRAAVQQILKQMSNESGA